MPVPSPTQLVPLNWAMRLTSVATECVELPPAWVELLNRSVAVTVLLKPAPSENQEGRPKVGSLHWAIRLAATPPAKVKSPPTTRWRVRLGPPPVVKLFSAWTASLV